MAAVEGGVGSYGPATDASMPMLASEESPACDASTILWCRACIVED